MHDYKYKKSRIIAHYNELLRRRGFFYGIYSLIVRRLLLENIIVDRSYVRFTVKTFNECGKLFRNRSGRPNRLSKNENICSIVNRRMNENDEETAKNLQAMIQSRGYSISVPLVNKIRKRLGWTLKGTRYCQMIRHNNKGKRLEWANDHINDTFDEVIWTDETSVWLEQHMKRCYRKKGVTPKRKPKPKYPLKLHVWAGISRKGATEVCIFNGIMDATLYVDILQRTLLPFIRDKYPNGHRFMQDNDPKHRSAKAKNFFELNHINWWKTPAATEKMIIGLKNETEQYRKKSFEVKKVQGRGRSVFSKREIKKGEYVMEYTGVCKIYNAKEYDINENMYSLNEELSYCLEFNFEGSKYVIDATREYKCGIARLINHARNPNLKIFKPLKVENDGQPRIAMFAASNINVGEELFWNYFSTINPKRGLLDGCLTKKMHWIYSRRLKSGKLSYRIPQKKSSDRSGLCLVCYKCPKKLSSHLINVHSIKCRHTRLNMIKNGRKFCNLNKKICVNVGRRPLTCTLCGKTVLQLSVHLTRIHNINGGNNSEIVKQARKRKLADEADERKKELAKNM